MRPLAGKKRKFDPLVGGRDTERTAGVVDRILRATADDIVDAPLAASRLEAERRAAGSGEGHVPKRAKAPLRRSKAGRTAKPRGLPAAAARAGGGSGGAKASGGKAGGKGGKKGMKR